MITVRRSDTGAHVLVHEPSDTVMVGEDLAATHARMEEHLRDNPSLATGPAPAAATSAVASRWAWLVGLGVLALLPFLWLAVLHYTLGGLIDELRTAPATDATEQLMRLQGDVQALEQTLSRIEDAQGQARTGEPAVERPARKAARRPTDASDPEQDTVTGERTREMRAREAALRKRRLQEAATREQGDPATP